MQKNKLIRILQRVVGKNTGATFLKSGNLLNKLKELGEESTKELADSFYDRVAKEKEIYEKGYLLGLINRTKKPVYRIEYPPCIYYFIGTEADILRKIDKYSKEQDSTKKDDQTQKEKNESKDIEISDKELSDLF